MIEELSKRRVFRVVSGYAVVCFVCLQIADVTFEPLGIGQSILKIVIAVMLLALPIVTYIAWVFDVRPDHSIQRVSGNKPKLEVAVTFFSVVLLGVGCWMVLSPNSTLDLPKKNSPELAVTAAVPTLSLLHNSVAVLPFSNLSSDPENSYFAAGIHEEVLNQLVKIKDLSVIARTTMLRYADTDKTVPEIGTELNVGVVMEGSVRYAGDRVRITAQLIDASSGAHLWSKAYEEDLEDVFGIQLDIATKIAKTLEAEFSPSEQARISAPDTDNSAAYAHYLRAISSWGNYAPTGTMHEDIDAAIQLDPHFGAALSFKSFLHIIEALAGGQFVGPDFDVEDQRRFSSLARDYALRALAIDSTLARSHWTLGWVNVLNRKWQASQQSFERAYELGASDYIVLNGAAWASLHRGDIDTGIQRMARSVALNPGDFSNQANYLGFLIMCQSWDAAYRQAGVMTTLVPNAPVPFIELTRVASFVGDSVGVRTNAVKAEVRTDLPSAEVANAYRRIGDHKNARRIFDELSATDQANSYNSVVKASMHTAIQENEVALDYLEQALNEGFPWPVARDLHYLSRHPMFDSLRTYPKFRELVLEAGLPRESD